MINTWDVCDYFGPDKSDDDDYNYDNDIVDDSNKLDVGLNTDPDTHW